MQVYSQQGLSIKLRSTLSGQILNIVTDGDNISGQSVPPSQ